MAYYKKRYSMKKFKKTFRKGRRTFTKWFKTSRKRTNAVQAMRKRGWK